MHSLTLNRLRPLHLALALACGSLRVVPAADLTVTPANNSGLYDPGDAIEWTLRGTTTQAVHYVVKQGGHIESLRGTVQLAGGLARVTCQSTSPGWILAEFSVDSPGTKPLKVLGGAVLAPNRISPAEERPQDFDRFWEDKLEELRRVPANPRLSGMPVDKPGVSYARLSLDNIRGTHIQGQVARPTQGRKFPAMLIVQWAGVYALQQSWVLDRAAEGWLCLNINAHDLPIAEPEQFYKDQASGPLKDYPSIGNDNRESSYFLRMYLSCYRAAQYLADRPDWNGKTLVVTGGSQGGLQSLVTAALHPAVTAVLANVPAGCDLNGPLASRMPGWPMWHWNTRDKDASQVRQAARYYDVVNFASRVRCPVLVGIGLIDTVCPPPGIYAACNQLPGPLEIVLLPVAEHGEKNGSHARYYSRFEAWKNALAQGDPPPLP